MTNYFVSPTGSDSNAGTSSGSPWQTVGKVNSTSLNPGDTVSFQGGQTFSGTKLFLTSAGTTLNPIVIGSYGTGNATITNGADDAIFISNAGGYTIQNLNVPGISGSTSFNGIELFASGTGQLPAIKVLNCVVSGWKWGFVAGGGTFADGWNGITISGGSYNGNVYGGITTYGPTFNPASPAYCHSNVTVQNLAANSNLGSAVITADVTGNGVVLGSVNGGSITGCVATGNGTSNGNTTNGPVGLWCYASSGVTIGNNLAYNNGTGTIADGDGIDIDIDCVGCVAQYNIAYGNAGAGILAWGGGSDNFWGTTAPNVIRWNVCWGNGTNGAANSNFYGDITAGGNISNLEVYNNTCVSRAASGAFPCAFAVPAGASLTNVTVRNNIFYCGSTGDVAIIAPALTTASLLMQGNLYYSTSSFALYYGGTTYASLTGFRSGTGQEILSGANTGIQADPQLQGAAATPTITSLANLTGARILQIRASSPCAGAGLDLNTLFSINPGSRDFIGAPISAPLPVGAMTPLSAPVLQAGTIATSTGLNAYSNACSFLLGGAAGVPRFFLQAKVAQSLSTTAASISFDSTASIFVDNAGGFSNSSPNRYTVQVPGYYTIAWCVSALAGTTLNAYLATFTGSSNPYNPSVAFQSNFQDRVVTGSNTCAISQGMAPSYLVPGDLLVVQASIGSGTTTTNISNPPQFSGQWVSA